MTAKPLSALLCLTALLAACGETVGLQKDYVKMRDTCQQYAEQKVGWLISRNLVTDEPKEKNTKLVEEFNSCMTTRGWDIGKPKDAPDGGEGGIIDTAKVKSGSGAGRSGVGIGVGPLYQLEESGRAAGAAARPDERGVGKSVVPVPVLVPAPVPVPIPEEGTVSSPPPAAPVMVPVVPPAPVKTPSPAVPAEPAPSRYDPKTPPPSLSPDEARRVKRILETGEE